MVKTEIHRASQWIQILDPAADVVPTPIQFSPVNTSGQADYISQHSLPMIIYCIYLVKSS